MIPISEATKKKIESLLEPGQVVELRVEGPKVLTSKRPQDVVNIELIPTLVNQEQDVHGQLVVQQSGEDPVPIANFIVPAGFMITGIRGGQRESE